MRASESSRDIASYYGQAPPHVAIGRNPLISDHPRLLRAGHDARKEITAVGDGGDGRLVRTGDGDHADADPRPAAIPAVHWAMSSDNKLEVSQPT